MDKWLDGRIRVEPPQIVFDRYRSIRHSNGRADVVDGGISRSGSRRNAGVPLSLSWLRPNKGAPLRKITSERKMDGGRPCPLERSWRSGSMSRSPVDAAKLAGLPNRKPNRKIRSIQASKNCCSDPSRHWPPELGLARCQRTWHRGLSAASRRCESCGHRRKIASTV